MVVFEYAQSMLTSSNKEGDRLSIEESSKGKIAGTNTFFPCSSSRQKSALMEASSRIDAAPDTAVTSLAQLEDAPVVLAIAPSEIQKKLEAIRLMYVLICIALFLLLVEFSKILLLLKSVRDIVSFINTITYDKIKADADALE